MNTRRCVAAWLHVAAGAFIVGLVVTLWVCAAMLASTVDGSFIPELVAMFGRPIAVALIAFGTIQIGAAVALLRGREWARVALGIVSALLAPVFPIGTALAVYTGWALVTAPSPQTLA